MRVCGAVHSLHMLYAEGLRNLAPRESILEIQDSGFRGDRLALCLSERNLRLGFRA